MIEILEKCSKPTLLSILTSYCHYFAHNVEYNLCDKLWEEVRDWHAD